jgi:peptidyl-prolyl cis-trans isomerase-like protein 2
LLVWNHDIAAFIVVTYIIFKNFCFLYSEQQKMNSDPTYNINMSGDIKQMLKELGTEEGKETALHGGGGGKAQKERAAALAAILAARSQVKEDSKSNPDGAPQALSIVDAASAAVHGRSAAAAKASSSDKTAARIAMHVAGDRAPVNAKMVRFLDTSF